MGQSERANRHLSRTAEGDSPIFAACAAKIGTVPVNGYARDHGRRKSGGVVLSINSGVCVVPGKFRSTYSGTSRRSWP